MRRTKRSGGFLLCLLLNLLINLDGLLPAVLLFALHKLAGWSLWWPCIAAGLWFAAILSRMLLWRFVSRCSNEKEPERPNKNPYSARNP